MPKLNARGQALMSSEGAGVVSIDRLVILSGAGQAHWLNDRTVIANVQVDRVHDTWDVQRLPSFGGHATTIEPGGGAPLVAGGGWWLGWTPARGMFGSLGNKPAAYPLGAGRDGTLAWLRDYATRAGLVLTAPDGSDTEVADAFVREIQVLGPTSAIWWDLRGGVRAVGRPAPRPALPSGRIRLVTVAGEDWLVYWSEGHGLIAQIDGASDGYVLETRPIAFQHDAVAVADRLVVAWSQTSGEGPDDLQWLIVDRTLPRVPLGTPPDPEDPPMPVLPDPPRRRDVVDAAWATQPADGTPDGNLAFCARVVRELRKTDPRWGLNWKRGQVGDPSRDIAAWRVGPADTDARIVDILSHSDDPARVGPAWTLHSVDAAGPVRWYWQDVAEPPPAGDTHLYIGGGHDTGICDEPGCGLSRFDPVHAIPESKRPHGYDGGEDDTGLCDICQQPPDAATHQTVTPEPEPLPGDVAALRVDVAALRARVERLEARRYHVVVEPIP